MLDKIEMSLDDIIKTNKASKQFKGRGNFGKASPNKKFGGGVGKGRARGGITRSNYTRVRGESRQIVMKIRKKETFKMDDTERKRQKMEGKR